MKARMHWKDRNKGAGGQGDPIDQGAAEAWCDKLNREHPDIYHWVEPVDDPPTGVRQEGSR